MGTLSEKELSLLNDALTEEDLLVKKYQMLASQFQEPDTKNKFEEISSRHQKHFNELFALLG